MTSNPTGRLQQARQAFNTGNAEQSRAAHTQHLGRVAEVRENPITEAGHAATESTVSKCIVYGALDGLATSLILFAVSLSLGLGRDTSFRLLLSGCGGLGAAHALRDCIRLTSEKALFDKERKREAWELANFPQGEEAEMVELYVSKGVAASDASVAMSALSKHSDFFVDLMMTQELGLAIPDAHPIIASLATLAGFCSTSVLPASMLWVYMRSFGIDLSLVSLSGTTQALADSWSKGSSFFVAEPMWVALLLSILILSSLKARFLPSLSHPAILFSMIAAAFLRQCPKSTLSRSLWPEMAAVLLIRISEALSSPSLESKLVFAGIFLFYNLSNFAIQYFYYCNGASTIAQWKTQPQQAGLVGRAAFGNWFPWLPHGEKPGRLWWHSALMTCNILFAALCAGITAEFFTRGWLPMQHQLPSARNVNVFGTSDLARGVTIALSVGFQTFASCVWQNIVEYYWHRTMHLPWFYARMHKLHHTYKSPSPFDDMMIHPIEAVGYYAILYSPAWLFPFSVHSFLCYMSIMGITGVADHSGVVLKDPFTGGVLYNSAEHDMHHELFTVNYGFPSMFLDHLHGTYRAPRESSAASILADAGGEGIVNSGTPILDASWSKGRKRAAQRRPRSRSLRKERAYPRAMA